jgi:hypothetical protein
MSDKPKEDKEMEIGLGGVFAIVLCGFLVWACWAWWRESVVVSSLPAGTVVRIVPTGSSFGIPLLLETETDVYPLAEASAFRIGTPVFLEIRKSGSRYVCEKSRSTCIRTPASHFRNDTP